MAQAGVSTLGVVVSYGVETTASTKPTAFTKLDRINSIGSIEGSTETIDASALEDMMERTVAGRQTSGGSFPITVNYTDETAAQWTKLIEDYNKLTGGKRLWVQISSPYLAKAFFIVCQPPQVIPMPAFDQNGLLTVEMGMAIDEYVGADTKVAVA